MELTPSQGHCRARPRLPSGSVADNDYGTKDDDARLSDASPARDAGNAALLPPDAHDLDEDGDTSEPIPLDIDGLPRVVNSVVDIGAYEHQSPACIGDVQPQPSDGAVNVDDLLAVINSWGACATQCSADINNDQAVDVDDLLLLILAWGSCP